MKEVNFTPDDYNNNVYIDDKLYIITNNFQLVDLVKEKLGSDFGKFMETIFDTQTLNGGEIDVIIEESNEIAIDEFKDLEITPIENEINAILDDYPIEKIKDMDFKNVMNKLTDIATMLYKLN